MKPRRRPFAGTLDSLMDTTTNVVGILVIVLVITQLGVGGAVQRIRANLPEVTAEELAKQRDLAAALRERTANLAVGEKERASQLAIDRAAIKSSKATIEKLRADLAAMTEAADASKQAKDDLDRESAKSKSVEQDLAQARAELAKLKAQIAAATAAPPRALPKDVNLPNPREAAKGASPLYVICKDSRALPVPIEGLRNLAEARIRQLKLPADDKGAVDGQKLVEFFDRTDIGNRQFRLRIRLHNFVPFLVFEPRPQAGELIETMRKPGSAVVVDLHRADAKKQFARFLVWSDAFDAYLESRAIADEAKLPAGWEPMSPGQVLQISLASTVKVQQPPPPPPPKVEPPKVEPPPVQPPPKVEPVVPVAPPRPPLPRDDID